MGAFWQNRINPLKRDKSAIDPATVGAWAMGAGGTVIAIEGDGTITEHATHAAFVAHAVSIDAPYTWYTHTRSKGDLARDMDNGGAFDALLDDDYRISIFSSQGKTAALEVFDATEPDAGPSTPHWSFRDLANMLPGQAIAKDPASAVLATIKRVHELQDSVQERFGTNLEMTATRTGYMGWRRTLDEHHWRQPAPARRDIREAYRGGYTRAFTTKKHHRGQWHQYDIRSAYPAAMREGVPLGQPVAVGLDHDVHNPHAIAFYRIYAIINPRGLPVLMAWTRELGDSPIDTGNGIEVWCTSQELTLARRLGIVARVLYGWEYPDGLGNPFDQFVGICEEWRDASTGANNKLVKLIQNTLYGKFGTDSWQTEIVISAEPPKGPEWMPHYGKNAPIGSAWSRRVYADAKAGQMIHWAAWVTSSVRCKVINAVVELGMERVLYVDTDCIITSGTLPTGTRYGDWVLERTYTDFQAFGGKRYVGRTIDGEDRMRHAGISSDMDPRKIAAIMRAQFDSNSPP